MSDILTLLHFRKIYFRLCAMILSCISMIRHEHILKFPLHFLMEVHSLCQHLTKSLPFFMVGMSSPNYCHQVRLEIHTVACIKITVFSIVTLYSLVHVGLYPHSGGTGYLHLQDNQKRETVASSESVVCIDQTVMLIPLSHTRS